MDRVRPVRSIACPYLAVAAGIGGAALCALAWRGWTISGNDLDLLPAIGSALAIAFLIERAGRLEGRGGPALAAGMVALSVAGSKFLGWDPLGIVERSMAGETGEAAGLPVVDRWRTAGSGLEGPTLAVNLTAYLAAPLIGAAAYAALSRACRGGAVEDSSAPSDVTESCHIRGDRRWAALAAAFVIFATAVRWVAAWPESTGFLQMTFPVNGVHSANSLLGYAMLVDGRPVMAETVPAWEQVAWFGGAARSDTNFRYRRAGYAFLAAHVAPWIGTERALLFVNELAFVAAMAAVWRLATALFRDRLAAMIAVCLASFGCGFFFHGDATSPHVLAFALYYVGIAWLVERGFPDRRLAWPVHARFATFVGLVSLVYNVAPMLLFAYACLGLRTQARRHLAAAAGIAIAFAVVWRWALPAIGIFPEPIEESYLRGSLAAWWESARGAPFEFISRAAGSIGEALTCFESPGLLAAGMAGWIALFRARRGAAVAAAVVAGPVLACALFSPVATARGYLVYGSSCVVHVLAGRLAAVHARGGHARRAAMIGLLVLVGLTQVVWCLSHRFGWLGPVTVYFQGWPRGAATMARAPTETVSLTGRDANPFPFRRTGSYIESGASPARGPDREPRRRILFALASRFPFVVAIGTFVCASVDDRRRRRRSVAVLVSVTSVAALTYPSRPVPEPRPLDIRESVSIAAHGSTRVRVDVAPDVWDRMLRHASRTGMPVLLHVGGPPDAYAQLEIDVLFDDRPVAARARGGGEYELELDIDSRGRSSAAPSTITVCWTNRADRIARIAGWQSVHLAGRRWMDASAGPCLPAMELRVRDASGHLCFAAY